MVYITEDRGFVPGRLESVTMAANLRYDGSRKPKEILAELGLARHTLVHAPYWAAAVEEMKEECCCSAEP